MDERAAWRVFCSTGKIDDYLKYSEIKNEAVGVPQASLTNEEVTDANKNGWNSY